MSWKNFALQAAVLALLSWLIGGYAASHHHHDLRSGQEDSSAQLAKMNLQLARLEQAVGRSSKTLAAAGPALPVPAHEPDRQENAVAQLSRRMGALENWARKMQLITDALMKNQALLAQLRKQTAAAPPQAANWIAALPKEKRAQVQAAYREQVEQMQQAVSAEPDAPPPSPDEMMNLLQESREKLKRKLKDILDETEYQAFLGSLEESGPLPAAPLSSE